jgi:heme exporter protein C
MSAVEGASLTTVEKRAEGQSSSSRTTILRAITLITVLAVAGGLYLALGYAGTDRFQGAVQRIFYVHVAAFSGAFVSFGVGVAGGLIYLRTRNVKWDSLALSGIEVGLGLATVNLVTGMIWSRPIWNTWWTWDPRLTSEAIMILTYAAYMMLRNAVENMETRRRFASVYGILAMTTVIITLVIIRLRPDTIHPTVIGSSPQNAEGSFEMTSSMRAALGMNSAIWSMLVPLTLIWWRVRLQNLAEHVQALKTELLSK